MFLVNSRYRHFSATPSSFTCVSLHQKGHTFSRSYGIILPSSLTSVLSITLGFSPHPPESVYGTVTCCLKLRGFSWKHGIDDFTGIPPRHQLSALNGRRDLPPLPAYHLKPGQPAPGSSTLLRPPIATTGGTGILTCFPSTTPFGLALGTD